MPDTPRPPDPTAGWPEAEPTDSQLSAWLDGELPPETQAQLGAWLAGHPEAAARVAAWREDQVALRRWASTWSTDSAQPEASDAPAQARDQRATGVPLAWAAVLALCGTALGTGLGAWLGPAWSIGPDTLQAQAGPGATAWWQRAAAAHAVYVPEQRHPVEVDVRAGDATERATQERHLAAWLTKRLNQPVALFDLQAQGFDLVGGRLLPDGAQPGAQLMYQRADGRRVTVYLRRPEAAVPATFRYAQDGPRGLFYWVEGSTGYALVGELPRAELLALAEHIHGQIQGAPAQRSGAASN